MPTNAWKTALRLFAKDKVLIETQNHQGWKSPLRSSSPISIRHPSGLGLSAMHKSTRISHWNSANLFQTLHFKPLPPAEELLSLCPRATSPSPLQHQNQQEPWGGLQTQAFSAAARMALCWECLRDENSSLVVLWAYQEQHHITIPIYSEAIMIKVK